MKARTVLRKYAQSKGKSAKSFHELEADYYCDNLITKDEKGNEERTMIDYKTLFFWTIANFKKLQQQ